MTTFMGIAVVQTIGPKTLMLTKVRNIIALKRSKFQEIAIVELEDYGLALVLDGLVQSTEKDEYIYHECLVHPAMVLHPSPKRVLIVGGGEGATLREVLKHRTVESAIMVDIDEDVVELSKKYLSVMHQGAFDDPRSKVVIADGRKFIEETKEVFDVVVLDLTDPYGPEIARQLYTEDFYRLVYQRLGEDGVMVTQAGNSYFYEEVYDSVLRAVKAVFPHVLEYNVWIPSFGYACNFILGSKKYDPRALTAEEVDKRLRERGVKTRFFSGSTYLSLLYTPIYRKSA